MKAQQEATPEQITRKGVTVTLRPIVRGASTNWRVEYTAKGQRRQIWRADYAKAKRAADDAIDAVLNGDHAALLLTDADRHTYLRACEHLEPLGVKLDIAARDHAEVLTMLGGRATPAEVARDWLKRHAVALPKITVADAGEELLAHARADGKTPLRIKQLSGVLSVFGGDFVCEVAAITPATVSAWLSGLAKTERTRRNYRDVIGFFNRWLVLRGYLAKGTDWLEGVQNYTARKVGAISTYTPDEIRKLLAGCDKRLLPFIAIGAFAGLRHAEIARLDWSEVDLADGFIEVRADKSKVDTRRLVPIHENLKAWLRPLRRDRGAVCEFANITKQLLARAAVAGVEWKHNALRHSFVSYRVAECADVARTSDEAGNSPAVIRSNYLRRVKPAAAAEWFAVSPEVKRAKKPRTPRNVIPIKQEATA